MPPSMPTRCAALFSLALLAACGSTPPPDITLPTPEQAAQGPLRVEAVKWDRTKEGCQRECPSLSVESVSFPDEPRLSAVVDHALATMADLDSNAPPPYQTLAEFESHFWRVATPRTDVTLKAEVRRQAPDLAVLELYSYQYLGGAHGIPGTQYLNWQRSSGRLLSLQDVLIPGRHDAFVDLLRRAHEGWLAKNEDARRDPAAYEKLWPFQPTDNYALLQDGVAVKYQAYSIAPYSYGQPEFLLPYEYLQGILKPEFLPRR